jgi:hypothetical protein
MGEDQNLSGPENPELTQLQMLAAIGVLACLADDDEKTFLHASATAKNLTQKTVEAHYAKKWLMQKLEKLDVTGLPL